MTLTCATRPRLLPDVWQKACGMQQTLNALAWSQATFKDFANKMYHTREVSSSSRFSKPKLDQTGFTIDHYAGQVWVR